MLDGSWQFSQYFNGLVFLRALGCALWEVYVMSIDKRWRGLIPIEVGSGLREPIHWAKEIVLRRLEWHRQSDAKINRGSCS